MPGSVSTSNNLKPKSILTNANSNGSTANFSRPPENNVALDFMASAKKASDHSISQLISYSPSTHSSLSSMTHTHQPQAPPAVVAATALPSSSTTPLLLTSPPPSHPVSNKNSLGSSSKSKSDSHHRSQSSSNGSNNNNFLHTNNNSKQTTSRLKDQHSAPQFIDLSGDTDDGEVSAKKAKHHKHKHNKKSKETISMHSIGASGSGSAGGSIGATSNLALPNSVQSMLNHIHQQTTSIGLNPSANDEIDHNKIIHDLKVNRSLLRKYFDLQL